MIPSRRTCLTENATPAVAHALAPPTLITIIPSSSASGTSKPIASA